MKVETITSTPEPVNVVYRAIKTCVSKDLPGYPQFVEHKEKRKLITKVFDAGHHSVLEHVSFTFGIQGISRACSHQLVRHRIASYSQQSQRYTSMDESGFVIPKSIEDVPHLKIKFGHVLKTLTDFYNELTQVGIPNEDARFILPNACKTNIIMTMNLRALMEVSKLRLCSKAQWEIKEMFQLVRKEVLKVEPFLGTFLKAKCKYIGYCSELKGCGKMPSRHVAFSKVI